MSTNSHSPPSFISNSGKRLQVNLFLLLPILSAGAALATPSLHPTTPELYTAFVVWSVASIGITVGWHRYFTHRAFCTSKVMELALALAGTLAAVGPLIAWVAIHRKHHQHSDKEGDPHSPHARFTESHGLVKRLMHVHFEWLLDHQMPNPNRYCAELVGNPVVQFVSRHYQAIVLGGVLLPALCTACAATDDHIIVFLRQVIWAGLVRILVGHQLVACVNSICHMYGSRPHATADRSTNNLWVALLTWGEGWHNNHHHSPSSAYLGHRWSQIDLGNWIIRLLHITRLIWDIKGPRTSP